MPFIGVPFIQLDAARSRGFYVRGVVTTVV